MTYFPVTTPYNIFYNTDGSPLESGYIYIGYAYQNPVTNPILITWDIDGIYPAMQPVRTIGGYPDRNGSPAIIYVNAGAFEDYSILVNDKNGNQVYYAQSARSMFDFVGGNSVDIINDLRSITGYEEPIYVRGHSTVGDGGQGKFEWFDGAAPGTYVDEDGIIIVPTGDDGSGGWLRQYTGNKSNLWYGPGETGLIAAAAAMSDDQGIDFDGNITISNPITFNENYNTINGRNAVLVGEDVSGYVLQIGSDTGQAVVKLNDLRIAANGTTTGCLLLNYVTNVKVENMRFSGDLSGTKYGILIKDGCYVSKIANGRIQGNFTYGIAIQAGVAGNKPHICKIENTWVLCDSAVAGSVGIHFNLSGTYNTKIIDCYIQETSANGFYLQSANYPVVKNVFIEPSGGNVGRIDSNDGRFESINANASSCTNGILVYGDENTFIMGDWVALPASGYQIEIQVGATNNVVITSNTGQVLDNGTNTKIINFEGLNIFKGALRSSTAQEMFGFIQRVEAKTADYTIDGDSDSGRVFTNTGASASILFTLPNSPEIGSYYIFIRLESFNMNFKTPSDSLPMQVHEVYTGGGSLSFVTTTVGGTSRLQMASDYAYMVMTYPATDTWLGYAFGDLTVFTP